MNILSNLFSKNIDAEKTKLYNQFNAYEAKEIKDTINLIIDEIRFFEERNGEHPNVINIPVDTRTALQEFPIEFREKLGIDMGVEYYFPNDKVSLEYITSILSKKVKVPVFFKRKINPLIIRDSQNSEIKAEYDNNIFFNFSIYASFNNDMNSKMYILDKLYSEERGNQWELTKKYFIGMIKIYFNKFGKLPNKIKCDLDSYLFIESFPSAFEYHADKNIMQYKIGSHIVDIELENIDYVSIS